jgi:hypothetical protein
VENLDLAQEDYDSLWVQSVQPFQRNAQAAGDEVILIWRGGVEVVSKL